MSDNENGTPEPISHELEENVNTAPADSTNQSGSPDTAGFEADVDEKIVKI